MNLERATIEGNSPVDENYISTAYIAALTSVSAEKYYWTREIQ